MRLLLTISDRDWSCWLAVRVGLELQVDHLLLMGQADPVDHADLGDPAVPEDPGTTGTTVSVSVSAISNDKPTFKPI